MHTIYQYHQNLRLTSTLSQQNTISLGSPSSLLYWLTFTINFSSFQNRMRFYRGMNISGPSL